MKLVNLLENLCMLPASNAVCFSLEKRCHQRKRKYDNQNISEHTRLLEGQRSAVLESEASFYDLGYGEIEEQIPALRKNPKMVVLKVSLHCQGCAKKVRKHISKMEGVTSFTIDLEKKKVTVMGHISPIGVLESICRVKKAEFWPPFNERLMATATL
uniref:HMA domain-containing protein n=1 Tax=Araucaria cunninghamii TaxID=56994 RepID=A0A0D6QWD6_ARACU